MNAVQPFIDLNGVPYLQMTSVGSHSTSGRKKVGKEDLLSMEPRAAAKKLLVSGAVPPAPVRDPTDNPIRYNNPTTRSICG